MIRRPPRSTLFPLHAALPICRKPEATVRVEPLHRLHHAEAAFADEVAHRQTVAAIPYRNFGDQPQMRRDERSEEHTSELQSPCNLVCRLLLEKKKTAHATRAY